jgi:mono/diheme cytochrome c family protein
MKRVLLLVAITLVLAAVAASFHWGWSLYPRLWRMTVGPRARPLRSVVFERTAMRAERGRYLAEGPLACFRCHSDRDWSQPGAPPVAGKAGAGHIFAEDGRPWLVAPNITPDRETGAGTWTDDMFARAIREGVGHDGRPLHPQMWYRAFSDLSDEDVASIVVYLRTIPAVHNTLPPTHLPFSVRLRITGEPQPILAPQSRRPDAEFVQWGGYLASVSDCVGCHTDWYHPGSAVNEKFFAGGNELTTPKGTVFSANLTSDPSGIAYYDAAMFIRVMHTGKVGARVLNDVMPWYWYRNMSDEDLKIVFEALKQAPKVKHIVDNTESPTYCKLCRQNHGGGSSN